MKDDSRKEQNEIIMAPSAERGSVLLVALVFLVLTSLIAVTTMNTSVLEIRMAGNSQFREDAMQIAEGIRDDIARRESITSGELLPLNAAATKGFLYCDLENTDTKCDELSLYISSPELKAAVGSADVTYTAELVESSNASYSQASKAGNNLSTKYKLDVFYDGASVGLAQTHLSFMMEKTTFIGDNTIVTPKGDNGEDLGRYRFF